jgi:hypothetical protein
MTQRSFADTLVELANNGQSPRINVGLTDRNRVTLTKWVFAGDCLIDFWPSGTPRHIVPLSQVVIIEVFQGEVA